MKLYFNKKGFTLIEVLLAAVLFVVVISLAYNIYFFSTNAFRTADTQANIQRNMRKASDFISKELRTAYEIELSSSPLADDYFDKNFQLIYIDDGVIMKKYKDIDTGNVIEKTILNNSLGDFTYDLAFGKADGKKNIVEFEITADDTAYNIKSSMIAHNMSLDQEIEGDPGSYIYYKSSLDAKEDDDPDPERRRCFSRLALDGTHGGGSALAILRNFRDQHMMTSSIGKKLVSFYYDVSPGIVKIMSKAEFLKVLVRIALIPFIFISAITTIPGGYNFIIIAITDIILIYILGIQLQKRIFKAIIYDLRVHRIT